jgi:hypothetical protein
MYLETMALKGMSYAQPGILDSANSYVQEALGMQFRKYHDKNINSSTYSAIGII